MEPEELLVKKILNGDTDAFRDIVEKYKTVIFAICLNITKDHQEAENLVQETFIQVYKSLPQYQYKGLKTWIARIAVNKSIDWKRKIKAKKEPKVVYLEDIENLKPIKDEDLTQRLVNKENRHKIIALCNKLPEKYSMVLKKYYIQSKTYQQISCEEGISIRTVESRLYRAKKLIKKRWEEEEQYEAF